MTRLAWELIGAAVLAVLFVLGVHLALSWRDQAHAAQGTIQQQQSTAQAASGITGDLDHATDGQHRAEQRVTVDTAALAASLEKLRHDDPDVDSWLSRPVPERLRDLARQRREARERPGAAAAGSAAADQGAPSPGAGGPR